MELVREDIRHFDRIRPVFGSIDAVFHQAAIRITRCAQEPRVCLKVLIDGTFNVLQASVDASVKRLVAASSASVLDSRRLRDTRRGCRFLDKVQRPLLDLLIDASHIFSQDPDRDQIAGAQGHDGQDQAGPTGN